MFFFNKIPLFRLALPLTTGIITGIYIGEFFVNQPVLLVLLAIVLLAAFILLLVTKKSTYKRRWIYGASVHIILLATGIFISIINTERFYPNHISQLDEKPHEFMLKAIDDIVEKEKSFKLQAEVMCRLENGMEKTANGKLILYLQKDSLSAKIKYGDVLFINAPLQRLREAQNPAQFNYKQFLLFHQITRQAYVPSKSLRLAGVNNGNPVMKWIYNLRNSLLNILRKHGMEGREFAVGSALILGYTDELDPQIMRSYAASGALHVLSVSGLHVGIMYVVVAFFLSFLDKFKRGNIIKAILLLAFLVFYAMITGLSPSVLRATVMFGFIVIAKSFNYHTNIYNTLAVSLISLLIYDPYLVMQVGFQLSYLAVIGIVSIQPLLVELWHPKTKAMKWVWEISCVSIAAQIATSPLAFLYFHQFPVYFMVSNLIVIPLSTAILYFGLVTLLSVFITPACYFLTELLSWMVWLLNKSVEITESLPYSLLGGIDISILETWLFYSVVLSFFVFFVKKSIPALYVAFAALLLISFTQLYETVMQFSQQKFIVYDVQGTSVYDVINGKQNTFYAPSAFRADKDKMLFNVEHNWWKLGLEKQHFISIDSLQTTSGIFGFQVGSKRVLVINNDFDTTNVYKGKLKTDYVILSSNTNISFQKVKEYFYPALLIFDSSNSNKQCRIWEKQCTAAALKFYNIPASGAFIAEL